MATQNVDDLELFRKRMQRLSGMKSKETDSISDAIKAQDSLKSRISGWNGQKEIKKWRDAR